MIPINQILISIACSSTVVITSCIYYKKKDKISFNNKQYQHHSIVNDVQKVKISASRATPDNHSSSRSIWG